MEKTVNQNVDQKHYESRRYRLRWWTLSVLSVSLVIIGLDNTILNVALPTIQTQLQATSSQLQWMVDAYVLVFATGPALGGWLLENFTWGSYFPFDIMGDVSSWGSVFLVNEPS